MGWRGDIVGRVHVGVAGVADERCDGQVRVNDELRSLAEGAEGPLDSLLERMVSGSVDGGAAVELRLKVANAQSGFVQPMLG